ncbi:50S ribosomal protein L24 [Candidatus Bathyarchaeota archaeon]|nr:50S ribosomal protein L24 [Candidatus Bathyarchaeota archaeon]
MEKLVQRTIKAERHVHKRLAEASKTAHRRDLRERVRRAKGGVEDINKNIANARRVRHEKWEMGPLAPKRSVENGYGIATDHARAGRQAGDFLFRPFERERRCEWAGGSRNLNLVAGDRVVILEGSDKGKIDTIESVSLKTATVELKEFAKVCPPCLRILSTRAGKPTANSSRSSPKLPTGSSARPSTRARPTPTTR